MISVSRVRLLDTEEMRPAPRHHAVFNGSMDEDLRPGLARDLDATFEPLVRAHQDRLFSLALRFLGDASDAEEVVQDGFVRAYRALRTYDAARIEALSSGRGSRRSC